MSMASLAARRSVRYAFAFALYLVVTCVYFASIVAHLDSRVIGTFGDATLAIRDYDVAGAAGANPFTFSYDRINGAPEGASLLPQTQIAQPVQPAFIWVFRDLFGTVAALNLYMLSGLLLTAFAGFVLLDWGRFGLVPSLFGGFVMAFNPYMIERAIAGHVGYAHGWALVLLVAALTKLRTVRTLRWALIAGGAYGFCFLLAAYMGLLATAVVVAFGIVDLLAQRSVPERLWTFSLLIVIGGVTLLALVPGLVALALDQRTISAGLSHSLTTLEGYGARPDDYLLPMPRHPVLGWVGHLRRHYDTFLEQRVFVGYVVLALAGVTAIRLMRGTARLPQGIARHLVVLAAVVVPVAFVASLQPHLTVLGRRIPMPSYFFSEISTMYRVYARLGYVVELGLAVLAAAALFQLCNRSRRAWALGALLVTVAVFEFLPGTIPAVAVGKAPDYDLWLAREPAGIAAHYPLKTSSRKAEAMGFKELYYQRFTTQPLFESYAGSLVPVRSAAIRLVSRHPDDAEALGILAAEGVRYLVIHDDVYRSQGDEPPVLGRGVRFLRSFGPVRIYRLTAKPIDLPRYLRTHVGHVADQFGLVRPRVSFAGGFYEPELYPGFTSPFQWMRHAGAVDVENVEGTSVRIWLEGFGFSTGVDRRLDLIDATGRTVSSVAVGTAMGAIRLGPIDVPSGMSHLTLQTSPAPAPLGAGDPREASVFLSGLRAAREVDLTAILTKPG